MDHVRVLARCVGALVILSGASDAAAQSADGDAAHTMAAMAREGSGTSWLPDASPMFMLHRQSGPWMLMGHENAFLQFLKETGDRGDSQVGSINWVMGMAERDLAHGRLALRGMFSLEPWTIRGCGYPDLLASGEECGGEQIHDHQHPHDLPMEISARFDAPLTGDLRWQVYGGPAAEPALGPVAFAHRVSAMPDPVAPITHHWLDSTHVSFGVVTGGIYSRRWKAETSIFNGREPDENRKDFDFGALDSVSGRLWFLPTATVALQFSAGHLRQAEAGAALGPRQDVNRITASATFDRTGDRHIAATTFAWGQNVETGHRTNALLLETNVTVDDRHAWFGRLEVTQKTPHDLDVPPIRDTFTVSKIQGGYTRYVSTSSSLKAGLGGVISASLVPGDLVSIYGRRVNPGVAVFITLRPAMTVAASQDGATGGSTRPMVMVQTAYDPTKLTCPAGFDPRSAATATYDGRTYYFCSDQDRDTFLTDPKMSLSMMPPKQ